MFSSPALPVFFSHDGGVDDFIALLLILSQTAHLRSDANAIGRPLRLLGIDITEAITYADPALEATRRLLSLCDAYDVPVAVSTLPGVHEFPRNWRLEAYKVAAFPLLNQPRVAPVRIPVPAGVTGQQLLLDTLRAATTPITLIVTGPLTNLAWALSEDPPVVDNIDCTYVMGGAVHVGGNVGKTVGDKSYDGSAEWNIFWDPPAAKAVLEGHPNLPVRLISLDVTDTIPVTEGFLRAFGLQCHHELSHMVGCIYSLGADQMHRTGSNYFAWDVLTIAAVLDPTLFEWERVHLRVHTDALDDKTVGADGEPTGAGSIQMPSKAIGQARGGTADQSARHASSTMDRMYNISAGRTEPVPADTPGTKPVLVAKKGPPPQHFYDLVLRACACSPPHGE